MKAKIKKLPEGKMGRIFSYHEVANFLFLMTLSIKEKKG